MKGIGIDPGTKTTAWATGNLNKHQTGVLLAPGVSEMAGTIKTLILAHQANGIEYVAIEDFVHETHHNRRIPTAPEMGWLIGTIQAYAEASGLMVVKYPAFDTKANMSMIAKRFKTTHEFSALCVLNYAQGQIGIEKAVAR